MNNQSFSAWQFGRRFTLGAITLALVVTASGRSGAASGSRFDVSVQRNQQSNAQRGQATPTPRPDGQKPNQPRLPWWKDPVVIKEIRLTPDQANRIDAIWKKRETDMHGVATEHRKQKDELDRLIKQIDKEMKDAAKALEFEKAAALRDQLMELRSLEIIEAPVKRK